MFRKLFIPLLLMTLLFSACSESIPEVNPEEILRNVVESIDREELKGYAEKGAEALMEKFPALKKLADKEKMQELLKEHGLKLLHSYIESTEPETQENARKLGEILIILNPELTDEVEKALGAG